MQQRECAIPRQTFRTFNTPFMYLSVRAYCRRGSSSSSANRCSVNGGASNSSSIRSNVSAKSQSAADKAKADKARRKQLEVAAQGLPRTGSRRGPTIRLGAEDAPVENIKQRRSRLLLGPLRFYTPYFIYHQVPAGPLPAWRMVPSLREA